jgi:hypothetical protein
MLVAEKGYDFRRFLGTIAHQEWPIPAKDIQIPGSSRQNHGFFAV